MLCCYYVIEKEEEKTKMPLDNDEIEIQYFLNQNKKEGSLLLFSFIPLSLSSIGHPSQYIIHNSLLSIEHYIYNVDVGG
jgi:hypothetical protein